MARTAVDRFEQRKQTRQLLIDAALELFSKSGYEYATVDDISNAAGFSKGAYYFHFSTKDDVLLELVRLWTESRSAVLADAEDVRSRDDLKATLMAFFAYDDEPRWPGALLEFWAQALRNNEVSKRLSQAYASWRKQLAEAFARAGVAEGTAAEDAASVALASHDGFAVQVAIGSPAAKAITAADLAESLVAPAVQQAARRRAM